MTLEEVKAMLDKTGLPVVYREWPQNPEEGLPPPLPWLCYLVRRGNHFAADGIVYYAAPVIDVELYSADKDPVSESAVEAVLTAAGLFYSKTEIWLEDEKMYEILYETEV